MVLPDQFRITLTSRTSTIPVNITNNLNQPLKVRIEFDSGQLEFLDGDVVNRALPPGVTRLDVRVRALTSGAFPMGITVRSPDSSIELDQTTFDIRSTAVTGVGLVLSIGAGLFLAVWWARHWRGSRRSRHLVPSGAAPASPATAVAGSAQPDATTDGPSSRSAPGATGRRTWPAVDPAAADVTGPADPAQSRAVRSRALGSPAMSERPQCSERGPSGPLRSSKSGK